MNPVEFNKLIYQVFHHSAEGRRLLEGLKERYYSAPSCNPNAIPPHPEWFAYFRDGENNVIRMIERTILNIKHLEDSKNV